MTTTVFLYQRLIYSAGRSLRVSSKEREQLKHGSRQLRLKEVRSAQLQREPDQSEPKANVSVRHILLGVPSRPFRQHSMMSDVFDWTGCLSLTPEQFTLCGFDGNCLLPSESVQATERTMQYMTKSDITPDLTSEDSPGGGEYSQKNLVGVCGPLPKTLTLFMTKICDIPYPIYDLTKNSKPN